MASTLTWLHLSDLHMQREEEYNVSAVLDALWEDLPVQIAKLGDQLDFIAITGDIAHSGKDEDYLLTEELFFKPLYESTGLTAERLYLVPGNHDVDWSEAEYVNTKITYPLTDADRDQVTKLLEDPSKRRALFNPMTQYANFVNRAFADFPQHPQLDDPLYSWGEILPGRTPSVGLIGLNSAWFSGFARDERGKVKDRSSLLLGEKQVRDALRKTKGCSLRIALMHHPPHCLQEFDQRDVERLLRGGCDLVLHGHLHHPDFIEVKALGGDAIYIPAGTVYLNRRWLNGYNLGQLDLNTGTGTIVLRRYGDDQGWIADVVSTGDERAGVIEFKFCKEWRLGAILHRDDGPAISQPFLPSTVAPDSLAGQVFVDIEPSWLRLGRVDEMKHLASFLEQQIEDTLWVWGYEGCGLTEFLRIALDMIGCHGKTSVFLNAEDADLGVVLDQRYYMGTIARHLGILLEPAPVPEMEDRFEQAVAQLAAHRAEVSRPPILVFANVQRLGTAVREWVLNTLWDQLLFPLRHLGMAAIIACEGPLADCPPANDRKEIYLREFVVEDVERYLESLPSLDDPDSESIPNLARMIHSPDREEYLAQPRRVYDNLVQAQGAKPNVRDLMVCAVPFRLTRSLAEELADAPRVPEELFREWERFGLGTLRDANDFRYCPKIRTHLVLKLEQSHRSLAQQAHRTAIDRLGTPAYPTPDDDHERLWRAYHTSPLNPPEGAVRYWSLYCSIRVDTRFTMLEVLSALAQSQGQWLGDHLHLAELFRAAGLIFTGGARGRKKAKEILQRIVASQVPTELAIDAGFLLATHTEGHKQREVIQILEHVIQLRENLDLSDQEPEVQHHLRLTLSKSFSHLASLLQARGEQGDFDRAEECFRHALQIVSSVDSSYEAVQLRDLLRVLQKRGKSVEGVTARIGEIERAFRQAHLAVAFNTYAQNGDVGALNYAISALDHGFGYARQRVCFEVDDDGSVRIEGTYELTAMSVLGRIDTFLKTLPGSGIEIDFGDVECHTPSFSLVPQPLLTEDPESETLDIRIEPPMEPGESLTYRWTAWSAPGTIAITAKQLKEAELDFEYVFWDIIAPIKRLDLTALVPTTLGGLPPVWVDLWRVGHWHSSKRVQTAYRASTEGDPTRVRWNAEILPPGKVKIDLSVDHPWLGMRYVLAWQPTE